ncbi:UDP-N-acetylglucosamine 1-carboxyvinyltransferase [Bacteroidales bacterium KA00251]|nr:UDP-N-acetylglucosamine 1-carboxyvinyltransferase [Bacteroidales bacterium KA00251]
MASFIVEGGHRLNGDIIPQGAKNEALEVIAATLLTEEEVIISNIPQILDVLNLIKLVEALGSEVKKLAPDTYSFRAKEIDLDFVRSTDFLERSRKLRGSVLLVGPLVGRTGYAIFPKPGGDKIGRRRLDTHLIGLATLGAKCEYNTETFCYEINGAHRKGKYMLLEEASVTGTANIIMTAVLTPGTTTIYHAACEPYIRQLCNMLVAMGAKIQGIGSNLLTIEGVEKLGGCTHRLLPDMIEVGSFIGMAAMTQSDLTIREVHLPDLGIIPAAFERLGIQMEYGEDYIRVPSQKSYEIDTYMDGSILTFSDAPWPGLTPDLLSVFLVVATQAKGSVLIHQKMFESRLFFVDNLINMGAQIILCDPHRAVIIGADRRYSLRAANMVSPDIRAGIALLIAAMDAEGISRIDNIDQIDRGYQQIETRLNAVGAKIKRIE